jgi:hypothetical protein
LVVRSEGASIDVTDAFLRPVSKGSAHDEITLDVPAGAYRVNARISANELTQTVVVRAGQTRELTMDVPFDAAAPVVGTSTADETHGTLAEELTGSASPEGRSRLVLVLRGLRDRAMAPLEESPLLHDAAGNDVQVPQPKAGGATAGDNRVLGWSLALEPGGYRLSWPTGSDLPVEQSVWLSEGWQTVLFVPQGPKGPVPPATSLHLVAMGQAWSPGSAETREVERTHARMRGRPSRLTEREWRSHLSSSSPALTLLALHEMLRGSQTRKPDEARQAMMLESAQRLRVQLGDHPDVLAVLAALQPDDTGLTVPWPPMLCTSIELVLEADRRTPTVVPDGSFTETTSGQRLASAPWMLWDPAGIEWSSETPGQSAAVPIDTARTEGTSTIAATRVLDLTSELGSRLNLTHADAAEHLGAEEIGRRLGMTTRLAEKCMSSLRAHPTE